MPIYVYDKKFGIILNAKHLIITMTQLNIIPAGYRFTFTSYENDDENRKTVITDGCSEAKARLLAEIVDVLSCLESDDVLFNGTSPHRTVRQLTEILERHPDAMSDELIKSLNSDQCRLVGYAKDNIFGDAANEYGHRVIISSKCEYIPHDIEIEDVTAKFFPPPISKPRMR